MFFELISWIYISLICLVWGNRVMKLCFGANKEDNIDLAVSCFVGLSSIGILSYFICLVIPLLPAVKLFLQIPALLYMLKTENRREISRQIKSQFGNLQLSDLLLLLFVLVMLLFIGSSTVIHPDTLNYHLYATRIFEKFGTIPGVVNVRMDLGFQSILFAEQAIFDFSVFQTMFWFPLNGCVMIWFVFFLVSKSSEKKTVTEGKDAHFSGDGYLILLLFCIFSWTQIRLTAASLSPDFIAAIAVLLAIHFFIQKNDDSAKLHSDRLAFFFSIVAVSVKLSTVPILLIPAILIYYEFRKEGFMSAVRFFLIGCLLLAPTIVRNIISSGYPFYPSTFADFYPSEWKIDPSRVLEIQQYITVYARYPVLMIDTLEEYSRTYFDWIPVWWTHLYLADKILMLSAISGLILYILFVRTQKEGFSKRMVLAFMIVITGALFWFLKAPDPRFGTGFLLALVYFGFLPYLKKFEPWNRKYYFEFFKWIRLVSMICILAYTGYRAWYFFSPSQLIFPEGIKNTSLKSKDCDDYIRDMILQDVHSNEQIPDSCRNFRFRGATLKHGFKPVNPLFH